MDSRYARQIIMPEIGEAGQRRLSAAKAAVVGAGGLGAPLLYYLASAGVGSVRIIDSDAVELTNLNRQFVHVENDIGREKALSAGEKLRQYNSDIDIAEHTVRLREENLSEYLDGCNLVVACVDNLHTRYILNDYCVERGIAYVVGGVEGFVGYTLTIVPGVTPCFRCIFPYNNTEPPIGGVLGATAGVVGSLMAMQAIKHIAGVPISSYFHYIDLQTYSIADIKAEKNKDCPACGER